jgi:hypothetical protein
LLFFRPHTFTTVSHLRQSSTSRIAISFKSKKGVQMLLVTAVFASILALMFIKLSFNVIGFRRKNKSHLVLVGWTSLKEPSARTVILLSTFPLVCCSWVP